MLTACQPHRPDCQPGATLNTAPQTLSPLDAADFARLAAAPRRNLDRQQAVAGYFSTCPEVILQPVGRNTANVICRFPGEGPRLVVGAHFDRVGAGQGIADNWTGIVVLAKLSALLAERPGTGNVDLVAFAEEENGLRGSLRYLLAHPGTSAMMNIDVVGIGPPLVDYRSDPLLICQALDVAAALRLDATTGALRQTSGDWEVFSQAGIPVVNLHSLNRQNIDIIHTRRDRFAAVQANELEAAWQLAASLVLTLLAG